MHEEEAAAISSSSSSHCGASSGRSVLIITSNHSHSSTTTTTQGELVNNNCNTHGEDDFMRELNEMFHNQQQSTQEHSEMKNLLIQELEPTMRNNCNINQHHHHDDTINSDPTSRTNNNNNTPQRKSHRNSFECVLCSSTFHKKSQLRAHILEKHSAVLEQENQEELEKGEDTLADEMHLREINPDVPQQHHSYHLLEEEGFTIDSPFLELSDLDEFNSIFSEFSNGDELNQEKVENEEKLVQEESPSLSEEPVVISLYKCTHPSCGKEFTSKGKLDKHLKKHEEKRHLCGFPSCRKTFSFRHELLEHIKLKHSPKQSVCIICNKEFKDLQALQVHLRTIHKNEKKVFRCHHEDCNKCYTNKRNLDDHIKTTHLKTKQFKCDICQRVLKHKASLRRHYKNVHNQVYVDPVSTPLTSEGEVSDTIFTDVTSHSTNENDTSEFSIPHNTKETNKKKRKKKTIQQQEEPKKSSFSGTSATATTTSSFESSEEFFNDDESQSNSRKKIKVGTVYLDRIIGTEANV
ncbi:hypothetical protein FDP41_009986 [Naegleria fowleri]|uniref:C2H2-type domain-containing protein n=1 Tax=Naegleria fowleri TaxID=5763 RepID=A0A6A5ATQ4_NAEFO|nr:uncharacterized protein FDP41_009986 [Naegleria fowleri]KAF0971763.1 hypothetical protein FDP41_009986 [Naegleria fowleri]